MSMVEFDQLCSLRFGEYAIFALLGHESDLYYIQSIHHMQVPLSKNTALEGSCPFCHPKELFEHSSMNDLHSSTDTGAIYY